ncbi:hypothetical protein [Mesorhizobium caraganae]|uniref:hypothetical protein n=1 Tax=Mesorhizobium caraganae TaxID=483206 RepID=UPI00177EA624|nr:hypothetical protein [Mesorhizobium caraganae]
MIGTVAKLLGLDSLIVYVIIAVLAGGGIWAWSAHRYHAGYNAGSAHERIAWQEQREKDLAQQAADKRAAQAEIDRLEAELQLEAQQRKDDQADADLQKAQAASPTKKNICLPREVGRAMNRQGR